MTDYIRLCPNCRTERELHEDVCQHMLPGGVLCRFPLLEIQMTPADQATPAGTAPQSPPEPAGAEAPAEGQAAHPAAETSGKVPDETAGQAAGSCANGHAVEPDDVLCPICGVRTVGAPESEGQRDALGRAIADWQIVAELPHAAPDAELFLARREGAEEVRVLRHYRIGLEPDPGLYSVLETLGRPDVAGLVAHGRFDGRAFEVWEHVEGRTLAELRQEIAAQADTTEQIAVALIRTLAAFEQRGLRHGNLQPSVIRLRSADPLVLCVTDLASARIAEFDVEATGLRQTSRYMAPEAVAEASTAASDWWSLGIILLEILTDGRCFDGVHERAFMLHLVARGIALPDDLTPRWRNLLEGLLTRNHEDRWRAEQALRWADGEGDIPTRFEQVATAPAGPALHFAGRQFRSPSELAFAAAEETNWADALAALDTGRIANWLAGFEKSPPTLDSIRAIATDQRLKALSNDLPLALAIAALNTDLPLCVKGELVTPTALLADPQSGVKWLAREVIAHLRRLQRPSDRWLILLADRAQRVRSRARDARISLDEESFAVLQLATSAAALEKRWAAKRAILPDSDNPALASLIDRRSLTDEDLLLLAAASIDNFTPAAGVLQEAERLAGQAGVTEFNRDVAARDLARPRRDLADELDARVPGFQRCGRTAIDAWMDTYRAANRRMPLSRLLVVLAIPASEWAEPPHQDYVRTVVSFLERRVLAGIQRGPLVQMRSTGSVLDVTELRGADLQVRVLDAIANRTETAVELPRTALRGEVLAKLQTIETKARTYQRDTGLDALFVGFPFLTLRVQDDDGQKTRIAPVLLWPVVLTAGRGGSGAASIRFDSRREVQLNPALETILGPAEAARWQQWAADRLRDSLDSHVTVLKAAAELVEGGVAEKLAPIPRASAVRNANKLSLAPSAAIFLAEFASQAIANDLRQLQQRPLDGTALACLLRLRMPEAPPDLAKVSHLDRFTTLEADPSQEEAVLRSRHAPGVVVQGPPGTGKSQTIVNIVTDCLGRNETVLVVCEKKAALDVVQKRLAAEQLGHRAFRIESTQGDRAAVLRALQAQVPKILEARAAPGASGQARRKQIAVQLDALEKDLDAYHEAVHLTDDRLGLTYREVLSLIAQHDAHPAGCSAPGLRALLGPLSAGELETVIGDCSGLVDVWLQGGVAAPALEILRPFAADAALATQIGKDLAALRDADNGRALAFAERRRLPAELQSIACHDADSLGRWLEENRRALETLPPDVLEGFPRWRSLAPREGQAGRHFDEAEAAWKRLAELIDRLDRLALPGRASLVHAAVREWTPAEIDALCQALPYLLAAPGLLSFLDPFRQLRLWSATSVLSSRGIATDAAACFAHAEAALFESNVRSSLRELQEIAAVFGEKPDCAPDRSEVLAAARNLAHRLDTFRDFARRLEAAPVTSLWPHVERLVGNIEAMQGESAGKSPLAPLLTALGFARAVAEANAQALRSAERLAPYLTEEALDGIKRSILSEAALPLDWGAIDRAIPALVPYQTFRLRVAKLSPAARAVFPELASLADTFRSDPRPGESVACLMRREAAMAWKGEIETRRPQLQRIATQIEASIAKLEALDRDMREANRRCLAHIGRGGVKSTQEWSRIWSIGGVNAQRLRQVFDRGRHLGLLRLRPVWLVNPDVASRMLPLEPGLFDVVIFDEASQMRVVNALPALYRAKRVVISGDEKQLPPTSFFGSRLQAGPADGDDDDDDPWAELDEESAEDGADAEAGGVSIDPRELAASERHIKDCEDLLTLAAGLLPTATLNIHYRSAYRELIAFSNAAYYAGQLNIPVRRPAQDVRRARPIEVRRVDGTYRNQTNPSEAEAIVDLLAQLWSSAAPPTVGVVTFNMKQAELIEAQLRRRGDEDRRFASALERERTRSADGEDVGFFVKNLENVQGDERDWILFSTTFGRDENEVFKRVFGALNQQGGERRLNVAVTRAKQKVVLVTSMPTAEISSFIDQRRPPTLARDYLQAYMRYAELVHDGELEAAAGLLQAFTTPLGPRPEPDAEPDALVLQALDVLQQEGFDASLMPPDDAFSLDIAVTHPDTGLYALGVELDSPCHHLLASARAREVWRPKLLARSGLTLHRIQSSAWVRDRAGERQRLLDAARKATARDRSA